MGITHEATLCIEKKRTLERYWSNCLSYLQVKDDRAKTAWKTCKKDISQKYTFLKECDVFVANDKTELSANG